MSLFRIRNYPKLVHNRYLSNVLQNEEYTAVPHYPPILDLSYKKVKERKAESEHEYIKNIKTVEEKQIKLNMDRLYGYKCHLMTEDFIPYNNLPLAQHITRTHLTINNNLPDYYKNIKVEELVQNVKSDIEEAVLIEFDGYQRKQHLNNEKLPKQEIENIISTSLSKQINRIIVTNLVKTFEHLKHIQVDYHPRIESTWSVGGIDPPKEVVKWRKGVKWQEPFANDPVDRIMVYQSSPILSLRSELPLPLVISPDEAENSDLNVPFFRYDPRVVGISCTRRHITNIPGFWPGDPHQFGVLAYHSRGHLHNREHFQDPQEQKEALHRQAILSSFGWLHAQANNLGFTTYNDITYPLVTQTIITSGKIWSFYIYQMNTLLVHSKHIYENNKRNICWATEELKLFEELSDGKIIGLNEDVIKLMLKLYVNIPEERLGMNLQPYLSSEEKFVADYKDDDKREWLEREYKFLTANRPRYKLIPEVYAWEKIYKFDNNTRFMDKRRTPFDKFENPLKKRLDDRSPIYIPRKFRPELPRWKGRYKKDYFP